MKRTFIAPLVLSLFFTAQACSLTPQMQDIIVRQEAQQNIPNNMLLALISKESSFCPNARSNRGAIGLGQLLPSTASQMQINPYDMADNIKGAATYLKRQYNYFGNWSMALAAYNAGPGNVTKYKGIPPFAETRHYVSEILRRIQNYTAMGTSPRVLPAASRLPAQIQTSQAKAVMAAPYQQIQAVPAQSQAVIQTRAPQAPAFVSTRSVTPFMRQSYSPVVPSAPANDDDTLEAAQAQDGNFVFAQPDAK